MQFAISQERENLGVVLPNVTPRLRSPMGPRLWTRGLFAKIGARLGNLGYGEGENKAKDAKDESTMLICIDSMGHY